MGKQVALITQKGEIFETQEYEWETYVVVKERTPRVMCGIMKEASFRITRSNVFGMALLKDGEVVSINSLYEMGFCPSVQLLGFGDTLTILPFKDAARAALQEKT